MKPMQRSLLAAAIVAALSASAYALPARAQDSQTGSTQKQDKKKPQELKKIIVTGSLIPTAEIDTATPVITITAKDIKQQGFTNIYQALRAQPLSTGQLQGQQLTNSFTPGAEPSPSLLGLPPNFTLTLVDGHPLSEFPILYNASFGITDISSIPLNMISQIQIVPGNQSSIYGSAAIAGVVNIILKKHQHGIDFQYQAGGYADGGGTSNEISLVGGYDHGPFSLVYGLQYTRQQPIWGYQRGLTASSTSNPNPYLAKAPFASYQILNLGPTGFVGIDPNSITPDACGPLGYQFGGTTTRIPLYNPTYPPQYQNGQLVYTSAGYACGTPTMYSYSTLMSKRNTASGYLSARYRINDDMEAYANLLYSVSSAAYAFGPQYSFWETNFPGGIFFNTAAQSLQIAAINFAPEVTGGRLRAGTTSFQRSYDFFGGFKGSIGNSDWNYNAYYARSQYYLYQNELQPVTAAINGFFQNQFLGPQQGTLTTSSGAQYPEYDPNYQNFYKAITPAQYDSWLNINHSYGTSYVQNANLELTNTDLFKLPAGDVGFAGVLQYGDESIYNPENPEAAAGYFYNGSTTGVKARRTNYAAAFEVHVPIFSMLSTDVSARFDHFKNHGGGSSSRPTYKISFAFRPFHTLLLRANYATAFRMPPLGYVGILPGASFYQGITDYYQCEKVAPGTPFPACTTMVNPNVNYTTRGFSGSNPFLTSITAKSWGAGFVWSPTSHFNINADYYNIKIANEVEYQSINTLLITDAQCMLGQLPDSSAACEQAFHAITRNGPTGLVTSFGVTPINVARERLDGITAGLHYTYDAGRWGTLMFAGQYNVTLKHQFQLAPGQPYLDFLHNPFAEYEYAQEGSALGPEYKSIVSGSVTWAFNHWTTTLYGIRYGKMPNYAAYSNANTYGAPLAGTLPPWILYNGSVKYDIGDNASVQLTVNNLFNRMPPYDVSDNAYPYYDQGAYNPYGRSYFVNFNYRF